jgi:hypothetical protein
VRRPWKIALVALVLAGGLGVVVHQQQGKELVYEGKSLSYWVRHPLVYSTGQIRGDPEDYVRLGIDSNAIPFLAECLRRPEGLVHGIYARTRDKLPAQARDWLPDPDEAAWVRRTSMVMLGSLGPAARGVVPELIRAAKEDNSPFNRYTAIEMLERIDPVAAAKAGLQARTPDN